MNNYKSLLAKEFVDQLQKTPEAVILDVRSQPETKAAFSFPTAINIPSLKMEEILNLDKDKTYFVHCRIGGRSALVCHAMINNGFRNVFNLNEDIEKCSNLFKAWNN